MKRTLFIILLIFLQNPKLYATKINYSIGFFGGIAPSMGGNLSSYIQDEQFNSETGIDGMTRAMNGYSTTNNINRLLGASLGIAIKAIFYEFYLVRVAGSYCQSIQGGTGKTIFFSTDYANYYPLECKYTFNEYDIPLTLGLSIPFWKDVKIHFSCGIAFSYASYENNFTSSTYPDPFERKGSFTGWAFPLVSVIEGEYFISHKFALSTNISYFWGSTEVLKDSQKRDTNGLGGDGAVDFARIDFTGYRLSFGISYYIFSI